MTVTTTVTKTDEYEAFSKAVKEVAKLPDFGGYEYPATAVNNHVANFHDAVRKDADVIRPLFREY